MATTIDDYGDELTANRPPLYAPLKPNQQHGRERICFFTFTAGTESAGLDVALAVIPKGARILEGTISVSATTGSATIALGLMAKDGSGYIDAAASVADGVALLLAAAAITTTAKVAFAATQALYYGYEAEKELYLTMTTAAAALASQTIKGHIRYVLD